PSGHLRAVDHPVDVVLLEAEDLRRRPRVEHRPGPARLPPGGDPAPVPRGSAAAVTSPRTRAVRPPSPKSPSYRNRCPDRPESRRTCLGLLTTRGPTALALISLVRYWSASCAGLVTPSSAVTARFAL